MRLWLLFRWWRLTGEPVNVRVYRRADQIQLGEPQAQALWEGKFRGHQWSIMTPSERQYIAWRGLPLPVRP